MQIGTSASIGGLIVFGTTTSLFAKIGAVLLLCASHIAVT